MMNVMTLPAPGAVGGAASGNREDAAEEDSEQNQHRQCGILRAKIGKKPTARKLCACGRRNEVRR
ncbi:hypothetical protein [Alistipes putredinis]|uniref:hypothetical protein n=1 Tax=Alistipes putredinis TaxID=28117 RepID=UPI0039932F3A